MNAAFLGKIIQKQIHSKGSISTTIEKEPKNKSREPKNTRESTNFYQRQKVQNYCQLMDFLKLKLFAP